jgi:hypothetical protein
MIVLFFERIMTVQITLFCTNDRFHELSPMVIKNMLWSLVLCVCFVDYCLSFCTFSFGHCVVRSSSIYRFWLPLWYLQTLHKIELITMGDNSGNLSFCYRMTSTYTQKTKSVYKIIKLELYKFIFYCYDCFIFSISPYFKCQFLL